MVPPGRDPGVIFGYGPLLASAACSDCQVGCHLVQCPGPVLYGIVYGFLGDGPIVCERREGEVREVKSADAAFFLGKGALPPPPPHNGGGLVPVTEKNPRFL